MPTMNLTYGMELSFGQTMEVGAHCETALKPHQTGKAQGGKAKTPNRTLGNLAVRDYRGASGNVVMAEM